MLPAVPSVLRNWGVEAAQRIAAVAGGTLNWNFDVQAGAERFFLRCYRANLETDRIVGEHELLRWVDGRGIPVAVPIRTAAGDTVVTHAGERWTLFPWSPGATLVRGELSPQQALILGEMHGRVQSVLAAHPQSTTATFRQRWDKAQSLELLSQLVATGREREIDGWISDGIERQRQLLEQADILPPARFASLPCQLLHGDFHDQQVLFAAGRITAVVDWEIWQTGPRAWELVRSLAFSRLLDTPLLEPYLTGYREHIHLRQDEAQLALTLWFQSRLVGLWAWWAYLMEGNERVAALFPTMLAELDQLTDERWTTSIRDRFASALSP